MPISLQVPGVRVIGSTVNVPIEIKASAVTLSMKLTAADIMMPVDVQASYVMLPVDLQAQYITLEIDIVAQSIPYLKMDIAAQTIGNILVDIVAQTLANLKIDIAAQTIGNVSIDLAAQSLATLNFNIVSQAVILNIKVSDQAKGIMLETDWATKDGYDIHLQGSTTSLAAGAEATLITITLSTAKEHWLYTVHVSGTQNGLGRARANKTAGYDELAYGYFPANSGFIKDWLAPVKRRKDVAEGITEITVTVKNNGSSAGDFSATLDGLQVVDTGTGEQLYTTKADWQACASQSQIDLTTSEGDVLLEYHA